MPFTQPSFENQTFQGIAVSPRAICRKEFSGCTFKDCDLSEYDLTGTSFSDCAFTSCNLSNIKTDNCRFRTVVFEDCKIVGVTFSRVDLFLLCWTFKQCKIELCNFSGLKMPRSLFIQSFIRETDFINADLKGSSFAGCDLPASRFHDVNLEKSDFTGARNYCIDPRANRLKGSRFSSPEVLSLLAPFGIKVEL
jgi:fluoroquinolone resistance protein